MPFERNVAQHVLFIVRDSNGDPLAGVPDLVAALNAGSGAIWTPTVNTALDHGNGLYSVLLTVDETDVDVLAMMWSGTGVKTDALVYYFESGYTNQRAGNLDNADVPTSDVPAAVEVELADDFAAIPGAVDTELADDFAAVIAAIAAAGAGAGANVVTLSIVDGDGDPVGSCPVRVENSGGQLVGFGFSNASTGIVVFNLDDGTYTVTLGPIANYAPTNPYSVVVSGATADDLEVVEIALPSPAIPGLCIIYEDLRYLDGTLLGASEGGLYVTARHSPQWAGDDADEGFMTRGGTSEEGPTDGSGRATLSLVRGIEVTIEVRTPERNKQYRVTVPDEDTARLSTLVDESKW